MTAHHAPRHVANTSKVLGNLIGIAAMLLLVDWLLAMMAVAGSDLESDPLRTFLWAEGDLERYWPPFGQLLLGIPLIVLGAVMTKTSRRFRRSDYDIPWVALRGTQKRAVAMARIKEIRSSSTYPRRRIGRRLIGLGLPSGLIAGAVLWLFSFSLDHASDQSARLALGGKIAWGATLAVLAFSVLAFGAGIYFLSVAPSRSASDAAALAEPVPDGRGALPAPPMPGGDLLSKGEPGSRSQRWLIPVVGVVVAAVGLGGFLALRQVGDQDRPTEPRAYPDPEIFHTDLTAAGIECAGLGDGDGWSAKRGPGPYGEKAFGICIVDEETTISLRLYRSSGEVAAALDLIRRGPAAGAGLVTGNRWVVMVSTGPGTDYFDTIMQFTGGREAMP